MAKDAKKPRPVLADRAKTMKPCPQCGGPMVVCEGPFGRFWGCRDYPRCRGTRNVQENTRRQDHQDRQDSKRVAAAVRGLWNIPTVWRANIK